MTKQTGLLVYESRKLSTDDLQRINGSLRDKLSPGVDIAGVLAEIESAIQYYWASAEAEQRQQKRSQMAKELSRVAEYAARFPQCAGELLLTLERLGPNTDEVLESALQRLHVSGRSYLSLEDIREHLRRFVFGSGQLLPSELHGQIGQLRRAALAFQPRGRPRKEAAGELINILALIYERAAGRWPGRTWDDFHQRERHAYFEACFRAAGMSEEDSRERLAMLRPILAAGRLLRNAGQAGHKKTRVNTARKPL